jgi:hypothetical protein
MRSLRSALQAASALMLLSAASGTQDESRAAADPPAKSAPAATIAADKTALAAWQPYVGRWKGVGQPRRGSNQGAWTEAADWAWQFDKSRAAIAFQSPRGKYYTSGRIVPGVKPHTFELLATRAGDQPANAKVEDLFTGAANAQGGFVFRLEQPDKAADTRGKQTKPAPIKTEKQAEPPERPAADRSTLDRSTADRIAPETNPQRPARISVRQVADGKRLLMLYERRIANTDQFVRLAEVGYTREGSGFAKAGSGSPECVVTGGLGTIAVQFEGKTYYVCCTGCRDLFNDDPAGVLADYRARKKKESTEKAD